MATLPSLLAGLPPLTAANLGPTTILPCFSATVDGAPVSLAVWRGSDVADSRFFLSADRTDFHELSRAEVAYPHEVPNFHPILTRTPGLVSLAVLDQDHSLLLLRNDPANVQKLQTVPFIRSKHLHLQDAALFVYSDGRWPALEGSLRHWWDTVLEAPPSKEVPVDALVHVVQRAAHKLNNAMSSLACGTDIASETLPALQALFEAFKNSPAVRKAVAAAAENDPDVTNALAGLRDCLPMEARAEKDPFEAVLNIVKDMAQQNEDIKNAGEKTITFIRAMQTRIPTEVPIGAAKAEDLILECEEAYETGVISPSSIPPPNDNGDITAPLLLVEDEAQVRQMLQSVLGRKGFKNIVATSSLTEALQEAEKIPNLKVVLTDFNLSATETGLDLVRELKQRYPSVRVLFMTGNIGQLQESFTDEEAERYERLPKPVDNAKLVERLRNLFKS